MQRVIKNNQLFRNNSIYVAGLFLLCLLAGCATRGNVDVLESRLRSQESQVRSLQSRLETAQVDLEVAQKEASTLRTQLVSHGESPMLAEDANVLYRAKNLQINKLLTGGLNQDQHAGDDLLNAVIVPVDAQGELVKVPGKIEIDLFDLTLPKNSQRIGHWNFAEADSQKNWHHGFIISGYQFELPWQTVPQNSRLLLHAKLTTSDGRQFDVSEKITVTPPSSSSRYAKQQPRPMPLEESNFLQPLSSNTAKPLKQQINPFSNTSRQQETKPVKPKDQNRPLGESPWQLPLDARQPLNTSDRRSNPIYESQSGRVLQ